MQKLMPIFILINFISAPLVFSNPLDIIKQAENQLRWSKVPKAKQWNRELYSALENNGQVLTQTVPKDIHAFCPNYENLNQVDRQHFWAHLITTMAELESGFDPNKNYIENFQDTKGDKVISRGLLQLSYESANQKAYGCGFEIAEELNTDTQKHLTCGVKILSHLLKKSNQIADNVTKSNGKKVHHGAAAYWSIFRNPNKLAKIQSWSQSFSWCQIPNAKPEIPQFNKMQSK